MAALFARRFFDQSIRAVLYEAIDQTYVCDGDDRPCLRVRRRDDSTPLFRLIPMRDLMPVNDEAAALLAEVGIVLGSRA